MRILVLFDMPTKTSAELSEYTAFHKYLIKNGFFMMQKSVYLKLALNTSVVTSVKKSLSLHRPNAGLVQVIVLTERQYLNTMYLVGEKHSDIIDSVDRTVFL